MVMIVDMCASQRDSFDEIWRIISSKKKTEENLIRISIYTDAKFHGMEM